MFEAKLVFHGIAHCTVDKGRFALNNSEFLDALGLDFLLSLEVDG